MKHVMAKKYVEKHKEKFKVSKTFKLFLYQRVLKETCSIH